MAEKKVIPPGRLCPSCNDDKDFFKVQKNICIGYDWYKPSELRYCFSQVIFLVDILPYLQDGKYPADPYVSGYVGGGFNGIRACAPFEGALQVGAEIEARLWTHGRTGEAGEALVDEVQQQHVTHFRDLSGPARRVVNYCSGRWRKRQNYSQWKRDQEIRKYVVMISEDMKKQSQNL